MGEEAGGMVEDAGRLRHVAAGVVAGAVPGLGGGRVAPGDVRVAKVV